MASSSRAPSSDLHFLFRFFLILISLPSFLAVDESWSVGHILSTGGRPLLSPSRNFTFGFSSLPDRETYLLSIWYTDIPDTIVWYATNQDNYMAPKGSKLTLSSSEGLVLNDPQGKKIWSSSVDAGQISHCSLNDTGNLMIMSTDGDTIWQSFLNPTDTLLPNQTIDGADNNGLILYSRLGENNFSSGRFMMRWDNGNIILNTRNPVTKNIYDVTYYNSKTGNSSGGYRLSYNASGHMYVLNGDGSLSFDLTKGINLPTPASDYYLRATLNFDGVFTWYYHQKKIDGGDSGWNASQSVPDSICSALTGNVDSGACGYNSICTIGSDQRPVCQCPPGYSLMDPSNTYGDCKPNFEVSACHDQHTNSSSYRLERLGHTDWPFSDYDKEDNVSEDDCKRMCLEDCFCAVAIARDQMCWKKKLPLSNGRKEDGQIATAFLKVKDADDYSNITQNPSSRSSANSYGDRKGTNVLVSDFLVASALFNAVLFSLIVLGIWFFYHKQRLRGGGGYAGFSNFNHHGEYDAVRRFTYRELEEATDGFKEELGRGACAIVYKGCYSGNRNSPSSQSYFAVKKIDSPAMKEPDKEFKTEVGIIGKTHHRNLVKLIGFCEEEQHRMLVYEFMSNGSLADLLFGELRPSWVVRMNIAKGIARGLLYLHEECATQIIHCDIKAQNILLDEAYNAKISDFGMSKLLKLNQFQTQTAVRGTKGYVAPDWFKNKAVDVKVDVYSFGVLLLEIVSCRRCIDFEHCSEEMAILTDWVVECYLSRRLADLVPNDLEAQEDMRAVEKLVMVAIWCIQEDPKLRATMRQVSQMLESVVEVPTPPCPVPNSFSTTNDD